MISIASCAPCQPFYTKQIDEYVISICSLHLVILPISFATLVASRNLTYIVNPANGFLQHAGGLACHINDHFQGALQAMSNHDMQQLGGGPLPDGTLHPHTMSEYQIVINAVAPDARGNPGGGGATYEQQCLLYDMVNRVLAGADQGAIDSARVALPLMGAGVFQWSAEQSATATAEALLDYATRRGTHTKDRRMEQVIVFDNDPQKVRGIIYIKGYISFFNYILQSLTSPSRRRCRCIYPDSMNSRLRVSLRPF